MKALRILIPLLVISLACFLFAPAAWAFCGFYVAKADAKLYNQASQVAIARSGNRTVLTMANDYQGEVKDFAIVVPVPVVLQQEQVKVADTKIMERLDAFSSPRLVEYFDPNPCAPNYPMAAPSASDSIRGGAARESVSSNRARALGVTIEAKFSVGEYDILILGAKESGGLETWLIENGYRIPQGARPLLRPYIRQKMKFFVAKVNLDRFDEAGFQNLRPLQIAYESPRFMLPIRLGMVNAQSVQDLIVYILSPRGQVEVTNYRTVKVPSDTEIPVYVKEKFGDFYKSMFQTSYTREGRNVAFLEYAWDMSNCDPCSAEPLNSEELKQAGVFWQDPGNYDGRMAYQGGVFISRIHVRYSRDKFPEDLMFQETGNRDSFQGRYIMRHPYTGELRCPEAVQYRRMVAERNEAQAQNLARLTGWNIQEIRRKLPTPPRISWGWWESLWSMVSRS